MTHRERAIEAARKIYALNGLGYLETMGKSEPWPEDIEPIEQAITLAVEEDRASRCQSVGELTFQFAIRRNEAGEIECQFNAPGFWQGTIEEWRFKEWLEWLNKIVGVPPARTRLRSAPLGRRSVLLFPPPLRVTPKEASKERSYGCCAIHTN